MNTRPESPRGVLVLEDRLNPSRRVEFEGVLFGAPLPAEGFATGEVVFNTSLTGYQEVLTDPSYFEQIVCFTASHIGNTGMNSEDRESRKLWPSALLVQDLEEVPSSWRNEESLQSALSRAGVPGLKNVDTRALTRFLRTQGVARGVILPQERRAEGSALLDRLPRYEGRDLIREVSTRESYTWPARGARAFRVVALDFGVKHGLLRSLAQLGCEIEVLPAYTTADAVLARKPDGVFLSNGPGDPSVATDAIETIRALVGRVPIFGVCMGHQLLGTALGARTIKMAFGHRGGNQPVQDLTTGHIEISSHNHGFAIDPATLPPTIEVTHRNLNDGCIEGLAWKRPDPSAPAAFSVQYHPEACPGPHDSRLLFDRFVAEMRRWGSGLPPGAERISTSTAT